MVKSVILSVALIGLQALFVAPAAGQVTSNATCSSDFAWASNSKGQDPCLVAAYLESSCNGGEYNVPPLLAGNHYVGPLKELANNCQCSTVVYSLVSACGACQNRTFINWTPWSINCTSVFRSVFSEAIPVLTAVPNWAYGDVVPTDNFSLVSAQNTGDSPESTGTAKPTGTTSSSSGSSTSAPGSGGGDDGNNNGNSSSSGAHKKSNAGAIAGGVVGGLVGLGLIAGLVVFLLLRRKKNRTAPSAEFAGSMHGAMLPPQSTRAQSENMSQYNVTPFSPANASFSGHETSQPFSQQRLYDPSDPSTFPTTPAPGSTHYTGTEGASAYTSPPYSLGYSPHDAPGAPRGHYSGAPEL